MKENETEKNNQQGTENENSEKVEKVTETDKKQSVVQESKSVEAGVQGTRKQKKRRFSKKQQIIFSVVGGVLALAIVVGAVVYSAYGSGTTDAATPTYETTEVVMADPLVFNGTVNAENTSDVYLDVTKGNLSEVLVTNGQEVTVGTPLLTYQSDEAAEQVKVQEQQLSSLNLAVSNAQTNLDSARSRKTEIQNDLTKARNTYNAADANTPEGQMTRQEQQAMIDQYNQSISAQDDMILQAQQALNLANLDVTNANATLEDLRGRVTTQETASIDGTVILNEAGKTSNTVPVVQLISKGTIVTGTVSEYDYSRVAVNKNVTLRPINTDETVNGTITQVNTLPNSTGSAAAAGASSTTVSMANYNFIVKPEKDLQYGYSCQITLPLDELRIPESAIFSEEEQQFVYAVVDGKAVKTAIAADDQSGVFVVREGLAEGDVVITNPDEQLSDGLEVTVS